MPTVNGNTTTYNNVSDDWYDKEIEKYKGSSWYDTLYNNPYLVRNNATFSPNIGQTIAELFGNFSAGDAYYGDLRSKAGEWYAQKLEEMRQEKYNSAPAQTAQVKAAGSNPDLAGGVQPGSAAENDQPIGSLSPMQAVGQSGLSEFAQFAMQAYSFASGFAKDMFSFKQMQSSIESQDLSNGGAIIPLVKDFFESTISGPVKNSSGNWSIPELSLDKLDSYASNYFRSRSARKRFITGVKNSYSSAKHRYYQYGVIKDEEQAFKAMNDAIGLNLAYGKDPSGSNDMDPMIIVSKELGDLKYKLDKITLQDDFSSRNFHKSYTDNTDPLKAAKAVNDQNEVSSAGAEAAKKQKEIQDIVNSSLLSIIKALGKAADEPGISGILAKGMLLYYSAFGLSLPSLPAISFGGTTNVTSVKTQ